MIRRVLFVLIAFLAAGTTVVAAAGAKDVRPRVVSAEKLKNMLVGPEKGNLIVVDVRLASSWAKSDRKIVGAFRGDPDHRDAWASQLPRQKTLVFYCS